MRYKTQRDIDYIKFREFSEAIEGLEGDDILEIAMKTFYKGRESSELLLLELLTAMNKPSKFKYRIDLNFKAANRFIDADTYLTDNMKLELAQMLVKPRHRFQKIKWTLDVVNYACQKFIEYVEPIKEQYEWLYNPPIILSSKPIQENTTAVEYMREFVGHYGAYMEIVYMLTKGDFTKADEVTNWSVERFLYQGEYLIRKKRIESIN